MFHHELSANSKMESILQWFYHTPWNYRIYLTISRHFFVWTTHEKMHNLQSNFMILHVYHEFVLHSQCGNLKIFYHTVWYLCVKIYVICVWNDVPSFIPCCIVFVLENMWNIWQILDMCLILKLGFYCLDDSFTVLKEIFFEKIGKVEKIKAWHYFSGRTIKVFFLC